MASIRELHREAASHGYPKTNCFIRPLSSTTSPTAGMCRTQAPGPDRPPGGLPSGVWYTPAAAPLPAGAGEEARGPLDSGSLPPAGKASQPKRFRVALDGTSSPYTAMSTSSQGAVLDRMDTTSRPSPGSQGNEPPPPPGPRDEAGAADGGNRPGPRHTASRHQPGED